MNLEGCEIMILWKCRGTPRRIDDKVTAIHMNKYMSIDSE
jgi:hypothetical protein